MDYKKLWAKKKRIDDQFYWLPLYIHLKETGYIAGALWDHWLSAGVKDMISKILTDKYGVDEDYGKKLAVFLGATHDLGKISASFAFKKTFPKDDSLDEVIYDLLSKGGFSYDGRDYGNLRHNYLSEYILYKFGVNSTVACIAGAHHGRPMSEKAKNLGTKYIEEIYQTNDPNSKTNKEWENLHRYFFETALKDSGINDISKLLILPQNIQVIFSGLLIFADRLTSNETYFPLIKEDEQACVDERIELGLRKWLDEKNPTWKPDENYFPETFKKRFNNEPRYDQDLVGEIASNISEPGIIIYEAMTGSGKTEAALMMAEILANKSQRNGIYFALPSQATSNAIFSRMKKWLNNLSNIDKTKKAIRLIHGKAYLNSEYESLKESENIFDDEGGVGVNSYFAGRKLSILDDFTIGTIDQLLLAALKQKHLMLKHLGLANKVVIIDEVHSYDAYMSVYLEEAIKWLSSYKVPIIILSATLPISKRNSLIKAYVQGQGKVHDFIYPKEFEENYSYPLLTYSDGKNIKQFTDFEKNKDKTIELIKLDKNESDLVIEKIKGISEDGGIFGIIVNTVRKSQELAKKCIDLFGDENVELLHSAFIAEDRYEKESSLMEIVGKSANRPKFKILIGTQVMEQSLDIDFDVLFTELAPIDLLIQRIGRLHRHDKNDRHRPENFKNSKCYVLTCSSYEFDKGSTYVYSPYILMRTEYYLPNSLKLPNDLPKLINQVYGGEDLKLEQKDMANYLNYKKDYEDKLKNKKDKAKVYRISDPKHTIKERNNIKDWLLNPQADAEISDIKASAQVRDSSDSIELICLKKIGDGYGFIDSKKKIENIDETLARKIANQTIRLPLAVANTKSIDKIIRNLEMSYIKILKEWDNHKWLKNNLAMIFDENGRYEMEDYILTYDKKLGLIYEKKE